MDHTLGRAQNLGGKFSRLWNKPREFFRECRGGLGSMYSLQSLETESSDKAMFHLCEQLSDEEGEIPNYENVTAACKPEGDYGGSYGSASGWGRLESGEAGTHGFVGGRSVWPYGEYGQAHGEREAGVAWSQMRGARPSLRYAHTRTHMSPGKVHRDCGRVSWGEVDQSGALGLIFILGQREPGVVRGEHKYVVRAVQPALDSYCSPSGTVKGRKAHM